MRDTWTVSTLLHGLAERDQHPAVIAFDGSASTIWTSRRLAADTAALAHYLLELSGSGRGSVAIWAPNSPEWIAVALGVLAVRHQRL
jgi:acyl-CoA synthetase (AMP-forming)/AMP-acid ligase II